MAGYGDFEANRVKHLEMIQAIIARLGGNGFLIKGWAVTIAGVFVGLAVNGSHGSLARIGAGISLVLWGLDAYFLRAERRFRELGDRVRKSDSSVEPFSMGITNLAGGWKLSWLGAVLSWTLTIFYGLILVAQVVVSCTV